MSTKTAKAKQQQLNEQNSEDQLLYNNCNNDGNYQQLFLNDHQLFYQNHIYNKSNKSIHDIKNKQLCQDRYYHLTNIKQSQHLFDELDFQDFIQQPQQVLKNSNKCRNKNNDGSLECTFKPHILRKSNQIAINLQPSFQRLTMPIKTSTKKSPYRPVSKQMQKQYSKQRIEKLSRPKIYKTQPIEPPNQQTKIQKKSIISQNSNYLDVIARNQLWQQQKKIKLEKLRKLQSQNQSKKQLNSFIPKILQYKGQKSTYLSNFGKEGIANYFERVNQAKIKNNNYCGKQNSTIGKKDSNSPYCSTKLSKTSRKDNKQPAQTKQHNNKKIKYDEAVKELHKKLMSLNI